MKKRKINQSDLARACEVTRHRISEILLGKCDASVKLNNLINSKLGLGPSLLWTRCGDKEKRKEAFLSSTIKVMSRSLSSFGAMCGVTGETIGQVLSGKSNASIGLAKCIDSKLGLNDALRWIDPERAGERKDIFYDAIQKQGDAK